MNAKYSRVRWAIAVFVSVAEMAHLLWEHFHGGIRHHHILDRADLLNRPEFVGGLLV